MLAYGEYKGYLEELWFLSFFLSHAAHFVMNLEDKLAHFQSDMEKK